MWRKDFAAEIKLRILSWGEDPGYEWVRCEHKGPGKEEVQRWELAKWEMTEARGWVMGGAKERRQLLKAGKGKDTIFP